MRDSAGNTNYKDKDAIYCPLVVCISPPLLPGEDPCLYVLNDISGINSSRVHVYNAITGAHIKIIGEDSMKVNQKSITSPGGFGSVAICLSPPSLGVDPLIYIACRHKNTDPYNGYIAVYKTNSGARIQTIHSDNSKIGGSLVILQTCVSRHPEYHSLRF
jgi:hypothetical protein